jgi:hypothetical protein
MDLQDAFLISILRHAAENGRSFYRIARILAHCPSEVGFYNWLAGLDSGASRLMIISGHGEDLLVEESKTVVVLGDLHHSIVLTQPSEVLVFGRVDRRASIEAKNACSVAVKTTADGTFITHGGFVLYCHDTFCGHIRIAKGSARLSIRNDYSGGLSTFDGTASVFLQVGGYMSQSSIRDIQYSEMIQSIICAERSDMPIGVCFSEFREGDYVIIG